MIWGLLLLAISGGPPRYALARQMELICLSAHGCVGVAVSILESGQAPSIHGNRRFPMQSVYKLPIAMAALHLVERGLLSLDQPVTITQADIVPVGVHSPIRDKYPHGGVELTLRELVRFAIQESDGTASDVLMRLAGGARQVTIFLRRLGINGIEVQTTEKQMAEGPYFQYSNWARPLAAIRLLSVFYKEHALSEPNRALLLQFMTETETGPNRIKGLLPPGTVVAHKTGSSGMSEGVARATNDIGIVQLPDGRHMVIAVFVSDSRADEGTRDLVIARLAKAAWDHWMNR